MANLRIAYVLWFFLGIFGIHHFYLHRDRQAFVWWSTLGGCFCLGWIRDFWRLPEYVKECNEDERTRETDSSTQSSHIKSNRGKPKISYVRFLGMMLMGLILAYLVQAACPAELLKPGIIGDFFRMIVPPLAAAIGVHTVANIGQVQASLQWPVIGAYAGALWLYSDPSNVAMVSLPSSLTTYYLGFRWKSGKKPRGLCFRLVVLSFCGTLYLLLLGSALYYNSFIITKDGESVPLREAIHNFLKSPAWRETSESIKELWRYVQIHGWKNIFEELLKALDPEGEANAFKVLGLDESATQEEIKTRYRKLAKEWHPDKQKDQAKGDESHKKFMEIQEAYNILSKLKTRRALKNKHTEF